MKKFNLKILWLKQDIGFSIDHIVENGYSPLTSYFFWPRNDAWTQVKIELDSKPWLSENDKIDLLNQITSLINYWQDNNNSKSIEQVQQQFPDFIFFGYH